MNRTAYCIVIIDLKTSKVKAFSASSPPSHLTRIGLRGDDSTVYAQVAAADGKDYEDALLNLEKSDDVKRLIFAGLYKTLEQRKKEDAEKEPQRAEPAVISMSSDDLRLGLDSGRINHMEVDILDSRYGTAQNEEVTGYSEDEAGPDLEDDNEDDEGEDTEDEDESESSDSFPSYRQRNDEYDEDHFLDDDLDIDSGDNY